MARLAVTIEGDLLRLARQASAQQAVRLSQVVEAAVRAFVADAGLGTRKISWPAPVAGRRALSASEVCKAINAGRK